MNFGEDMGIIFGHWARSPADIIGAAIASGMIVYAVVVTWHKLAEMWS